MPILTCARCTKKISPMDKLCPHCGEKISILRDMRYAVEKSRLRLFFVVVAAVLLLGIGWFIRLDTGLRWPLYAILLLVAPLVPWILQLAYKNAAPPEKNTDKHL